MNLEGIGEIIASIEYPGYDFEVTQGHGWWYLQATFLAYDSTGASEELVTQYTRKWLLSPYMTKSEIVQTAFKLVLTSQEHEVRENFKYLNRAVFGPHFDVDVLWAVADHLDKRKEGR
jgi:hypothetical protein